MNFYEHQDLAHKQTKRLLFLFVLALLGLILLTAYLVAGIGYTLGLYNARFESYQTGQSIWSISSQVFDWQYLGAIALAVLSLVLIASLFRMRQLSAGGKVIAEQLGGRLININQRDADEKILLNVVEEMAIASGTSVPSVYVIEESGINAFAAGFQSADAVIGVTRGAIKNLNRDELQGVVAHEFSHILNGDMRLNLRLIGMIYGIVIIANTGELLMHSTRRSSRDRGTAISIGLALLVLGYLGVFFGNVIKAAISRQREFLADASAVQFTRSKEGISGALQKIGGYGESRQNLSHKKTSEISHMLFSQGLRFNFFNKLMATHPPLQQRIRRIDPQWDGSYKILEVSQLDETPDKKTSATNTFGQAAGVAHLAESIALTDVSSGSQKVDAKEIIEAVDNVGDPTDETIALASRELTHLKVDFESLCDSVHEPYTARGLVFAILMDSNNKVVRQQQWVDIKKHQPIALAKQTCVIYKQLELLKAKQPLLLLDLALPILKSLSDSQYNVFKEQLLRLIKIDKKIEIREWALFNLVDHHCRPKKISQLHRFSISQRKPAVGRLLSALLNINVVENNYDVHMAKNIFDLVTTSELDFKLRWYSPEELTTQSMTQALNQVRYLKPLQKPKLLKACVKVIQHDGMINKRELELISCIAQAIDCPLPYMDVS